MTTPEQLQLLGHCLTRLRFRTLWRFGWGTSDALKGFGWTRVAGRLWWHDPKVERHLLELYAQNLGYPVDESESNERLRENLQRFMQTP